MQTEAVMKRATRLGFRFSFLTLVFLAGLYIMASHSQAAGLAAGEAKLERMYQQLMANPADLDLTLAYAELAVEIGDYEAAIPPLERLLISNPGASKLKLELGILYYLLGSHDVSKTYLIEAKQSAKATDSIKQQAEEYLRKM